jgi:hypothetical protein
VGCVVIGRTVDVLLGAHPFRHREKIRASTSTLILNIILLLKMQTVFREGEYLNYNPSDSFYKRIDLVS